MWNRFENMSFDEAYDYFVSERDCGLLTDDELEELEYQFDLIAPKLKAEQIRTQGLGRNSNTTTLSSEGQ